MSSLAHVDGEPIPGYRLKKRIGAGGYGEVWQAEAPGELLKAVKFVFGYLSEDRASRELKALSRIRAVRHPFLLSLERIEVVDGQLVIVTELADGSLKDRYEECKRLGGVGIPRDELLVYIRDAADALDYMSEHHSLQHLDVKPENLLLVGGRIKVADFGLVKELHDVSVSMLGGLTPLYAPPELFDGSPSRFCDQYSLAIVYMEMLTGVLPFPGTTAAQLATQHMNSRPRLSGLSPGDQAAIGRALSKDSKQRFESCREMVESLCHPEVSTAHGSRGSAWSDGKTIPRGDAGQLRDQHLDTMGSSSPSSAGHVHTGGEASGQPHAGSHEVRPPSLATCVAPVKPLTPLPPPTLDAASVPYRPTLFLGIGGTGVHVLARLHRRLVDRLGNENALAALPLLLLDTDNKTLQETAFGGAAPTRALQTLAVPLRKPQDYRHDSKAFAKSTSRRWLYNIPRSLQTDGMRPLGRLALADHAPRVCEQIHATIVKMLAPESLAATGQALGAELPANAPRVVIVASISGGAGSGTVLETAYAVRKVLYELGLPQELCGLLLHSTPRNQSGRDLAVANAVACLGELRQFSSASHGYPGDAACDLPAFTPGVPTFDDAFLLHLGDQIGAEEFEQRTAQVAEFAFLDALTPAGPLLRERRKNAAAAGSADNSAFHLRSFGLCQIGGGDEEFAAAAVEVLCQHAAQAWLGPEAGERREAGGLADVERMAAARGAELGLDFDQLMQPLQELVQAEQKRVPPAALERALAAKLASFAAERAGPLVDWVQELANQPAVGVRGAQSAAQWFVARLRQFDEQARGLLERVEGERAELEAFLAAAADPDRAKGKGRAPLTEVELAQKREKVAQLGQLTSALRAMRQVLQAICAKCVLAAERLRELARDVQFLASQFQTPAIWDESAITETPDSRLADEVRTTTRQSLRERLSENGRLLVAEMCTGYLSREGGLLSQFSTAEQRTALVAALRDAARTTVIKAIRSVDIGAALLPKDKPREWAAAQLRDCVAAAEPALAPLGSARRLHLLLPASVELARLQAFLLTEMGDLPEIIAHSDERVVFLLECDGLPFGKVVSALAEDRADYVEAASRLHTRSDIAWLPLMGV